MPRSSSTVGTSRHSGRRHTQPLRHDREPNPESSSCYLPHRSHYSRGRASLQLTIQPRLHHPSCHPIDPQPQPCMKAREKNSDSRRTSGVSASDVRTETDALDDPRRGNPGSKLDPEDSPGRNPDLEGTIGVDPGEPTPEGHSNLGGAVNRPWGRSNSTHSVGGDEAKQGSTCAQPAALRSPEAHRISGKRAKGNRGVNYRSKDAKICLLYTSPSPRDS